MSTLVKLIMISSFGLLSQLVFVRADHGEDAELETRFPAYGHPNPGDSMCQFMRDSIGDFSCRTSLKTDCEWLSKAFNAMTEEFGNFYFDLCECAKLDEKSTCEESGCAWVQDDSIQDQRDAYCTSDLVPPGPDPEISDPNLLDAEYERHVTMREERLAHCETFSSADTCRCPSLTASGEGWVDNVGCVESMNLGSTDQRGEHGDHFHGLSDNVDPDPVNLFRPFSSPPEGNGLSATPPSLEMCEWRDGGCRISLYSFCGASDVFLPAVRGPHQEYFGSLCSCSQRTTSSECSMGTRCRWVADDYYVLGGVCVTSLPKPLGEAELDNRSLGVNAREMGDLMRRREGICESIDSRDVCSCHRLSLDRRDDVNQCLSDPPHVESVTSVTSPALRDQSIGSQKPVFDANLSLSPRFEASSCLWTRNQRGFVCEVSWAATCDYMMKSIGDLSPEFAVYYSRHCYCSSLADPYACSLSSSCEWIPGGPGRDFREKGYCSSKMTLPASVDLYKSVEDRERHSRDADLYEVRKSFCSTLKSECECELPYLARHGYEMPSSSGSCSTGLLL